MSTPIVEALEKIKEQTEDIYDKEVEELALDSIRFGQITPELKKAIEKFENLYSLSLNDCDITNLENFPTLPKLVRLEIMDNKLNSKTLQPLAKLTELQSLSLGGNDIITIEDLEPLKPLKKLFQLDLFNCSINKQEKYRQLVFEFFPSLGILDNLDKDGQEVDYDDNYIEENDDYEYNEEEEEEEEVKEKMPSKKVKKN